MRIELSFHRERERLCIYILVVWVLSLMDANFSIVVPGHEGE